MSSIDTITVEAPNPDAARTFYDEAFGLGGLIGVQGATAPSTGFRGYTLSLLVAQPADADALIASALAAGATPIKPAAKSLWGYGGVLQAPDGAIWQVSTSTKKNTGPASRRIEQVVLLLGVTDMSASKQFYVEHGLTVGRSFGRKYVEFAMPSSAVKLALYGRRPLAKTAGVPADGDGSHRLVIGSDAAGTLTDPDGFRWDPSTRLIPGAAGDARAHIAHS